MIQIQTQKELNKQIARRKAFKGGAFSIDKPIPLSQGIIN